MNKITPFNKKAEGTLKINNYITAKIVKLVGDNVSPGVYSIEESLKIADDLNLDLVEVSSDQNPVICKVMDYQKYLYEKKKRDKKSDKVNIKEVKFTPNTAEHDFNFKLKNIKTFLQKGDRVRVMVIFKGREMKYKQHGAELLKKLIDSIEECGTAESPLKMEGNKMIITFKPKKK